MSLCLAWCLFAWPDVSLLGLMSLYLAWCLFARPVPLPPPSIVIFQLGDASQAQSDVDWRWMRLFISFLSVFPFVLKSDLFSCAVLLNSPALCRVLTKLYTMTNNMARALIFTGLFSRAIIHSLQIISRWKHLPKLTLSMCQSISQSLQ